MGSLNKYTSLPGDGADDSLPMYEMHSGPEIETPSALDESVPLRANSRSTIADPEDLRFRNYVPYQLEFYIAGLFPEFYFHFKKNFSNESAENSVYCNSSHQEFTASYVGSEEDIMKSVARVEADFDIKFRQCLHRNLRKEFSEWNFSRNCLENEFRKHLESRNDYVSESIRLERLSRQARKDWRVEPLVDFLTAFGYSEPSIWTLLIQALGVSALDHRENRKALNLAAGWKTEQGTLCRRAQAFADLYKAAAYIPQDGLGELPIETIIVNLCIFIFILLAIFFFFWLGIVIWKFANSE